VRLVETQTELLDVGEENFAPRSLAPNAVSKVRSSFIFQMWKLDPATELLRPRTKKLFDFSRRSIRLASAPASGEVVVDRVVVAVPPAACATEVEKIRPGATTDRDINRDEIRRTMASNS
jgi:hypothetical protein